jgi:hypothetical protein
LVHTTDRMDFHERVVEVAGGWSLAVLGSSGADLDGAARAAVRTILRIDQPVRSSASGLPASVATTTLVGSALAAQHHLQEYRVAARSNPAS